MLIVFDMDGTLVEGNSWSKVNKYFGVEEKALEYMDMYLRGEIRYCEFMDAVIKLWGRNVHISTIESIFENFKLVNGAFEVVSKLRRIGHELAIITVGLDILAGKVAEKLGIKHVIANGLEVDNKGFLTGKGICRVELLRKDIALNKLCRKLGYALNECVAIGDSKFDKSIIEVAGLGIAFRADPELINVADVSIDDLRDILKYVP